MASVGLLRGKPFRIRLGGDVIANSTDAELSIDVETEKIGHKDDGGFPETISSEITGTITVNSIVSTAADASKVLAGAILDAVLAGTSFDWEFGNEVVGDWTVSGSCIPTKASIKAANKGVVTGGWTFLTTGEITKSTNA